MRNQLWLLKDLSTYARSTALQASRNSSCSLVMAWAQRGARPLLNVNRAASPAVASLGAARSNWRLTLDEPASPVLGCAWRDAQLLTLQRRKGLVA